MTGFGSAEAGVLGGRLRVDIRTVHHRYFNPQFKLPIELSGIEGELRARLRQMLERGHVAVTARWVEAPTHDAGAVTVDLDRARQVVAAAKELKKKLKLKGDVDLAFVARQPDVMAAANGGPATAETAVTWTDGKPRVEPGRRDGLGVRARGGGGVGAEGGGPRDGAQRR